ncbi:hypothetical protein ACSTKD_00170, partial [Vibrio parahaemolyticus]
MGYGRQGLGKVTANSSGVLTISPDTWCSAMWLTLIGAPLEAWTAVSSGSQHNGTLTVTAVSVTNKTVTVSG